MKTKLFFVVCILNMGIAFLNTSCNDEISQQVSEQSAQDVPFMLHASNGNNPDARLALNEDGLTLNWEDGDQLTLVEVNQSIDPIVLTTTLTEPSNAATFVSEGGVPAGTYHVIYGSNTSKMISQGNVSSATKYTSYDELSDNLHLYGRLTVAEGQKNGSLELKNMFAMLKFELVDTEGEFKEKTPFCMGMISLDGIPDSLSFTPNGLGDATSLEYQIPFKTNTSLKTGNGLLVLPMDLTGKDIVFYLGYTSNANRELIEFKKSGINLQAGVSYTVKLNLADATRTNIPYNGLTTTDECRAAAISLLGTTWDIKNNLDFSGKEFIPFGESCTINGNGYTISNISLEVPFADNVGFSRMNSDISNLTLENVNIVGRNRVGGFIGFQAYNYDLINCMLKGQNVINGENNVGGIAGIATCPIENAQTEGSIKGTSNVGGVVGMVKYYGMGGNGGRDLRNCISSATVEATSERAGGIVGDFSGHTMYQCMHHSGTVKATDYAGGIAGKISCDLIDQCANIGTVESTNFAGGLGGGNDGEIEIINSYAIGVIESPSNYAAGLYYYSEPSSAANKASVKFCYFAGTVESNYGIIGRAKVTSNYYVNVSNCITTCTEIGVQGAAADDVNFNYTDKLIVSRLNYLNAEGTVYSAQTWDNELSNYKGCPKLVWQTDAFSGSVTIAPSFGENTWE